MNNASTLNRPFSSVYLSVNISSKKSARTQTSTVLELKQSAAEFGGRGRRHQGALWTERDDLVIPKGGRHSALGANLTLLQTLTHPYIHTCVSTKYRVLSLNMLLRSTGVARVGSGPQWA